MAFFKFRQRDDEAAVPSGPVESVEVLRKRAKHRLIGTVVLVLVGVIGFPLLVDKQPRPIAVDIPIEIPDKNKVKPLTLPSVAPQAVSVPPTAASGAVVEGAAPAVVVPPVAPKPELKAEPKAEVKMAGKVPEKSSVKDEPKVVVKELAKTQEKVVDKTSDKPQPKQASDKQIADSATRAQALLEGKEPSSAAPATEDRWVVQVGAFADATKAREARLKLERAGLKTYTQEVQTKEGLRIRVRVGPFGVRADADKAVEKIKKLDLNAAILTL